MQKIFSLLLIITMTILPMLSASASVNMCQHSTPQPSESEQFSPMLQTMDSSNTHDCCTSPGVSCDHGGLCDCGNGQAAYSPVSNLHNTFVDYQVSLYKEVVPDLFVSKNSESLYRPPITIL